MDTLETSWVTRSAAVLPTPQGPIRANLGPLLVELLFR